jgi:hypothetical protein
VHSNKAQYDFTLMSTMRKNQKRKLIEKFLSWPRAMVVWCALSRAGSKLLVTYRLSWSQLLLNLYRVHSHFVRQKSLIGKSKSWIQLIAKLFLFCSALLISSLKLEWCMPTQFFTCLQVCFYHILEWVWINEIYVTCAILIHSVYYVVEKKERASERILHSMR